MWSSGFPLREKGFCVQKQNTAWDGGSQGSQPLVRGAFLPQGCSWGPGGRQGQGRGPGAAHVPTVHTQEPRDPL